MNCKFYLPSGRMNAVTTHYVDIIKDAAERAGMIVSTVQNISEISKEDYVVTIENKDFFHVSRVHPQKHIHWFQGIVPEEAAITFEGHWTRFPRLFFNEVLERYILRHSDLNFYVSEAMRKHYETKYGKIKGEHIVMPCFNAELQPNVFTDERYDEPTFVYAGSLHKWQCFEPMLEIFKQIKEHLPKASLDIFTADKEKAAEYLKKHGVEASIDCLSPSELNERLTKYKYGFVVREPNKVNFVASPTKMSSYLGAGIIPIASDVVETFHNNFSDRKHILLFDSVVDLIPRIKSIEAEKNIAVKIKDEYSNIFNSFYNRHVYVNSIAFLLSGWLN